MINYRGTKEGKNGYNTYYRRDVTKDYSWRC